MTTDPDDPPVVRQTVTLTHPDATFHKPLEVDVTVYPGAETHVDYAAVDAWGDGFTLEEALTDLAEDLISLAEDLETSLEHQLGPEPLAWRAHLRDVLTLRSADAREETDDGGSAISWRHFTTGPTVARSTDPHGPARRHADPS